MTDLLWMVMITVWLISLSINLHLLRRGLEDDRKRGRR